MRTVIAAIDDSAAAAPVLGAAVALGHLLDARVEALHVADDGGQGARAFAEHLGVPFRRVTGEPLARILAEVAHPSVVAIAVGTRRRLKERGVGHLAQAVVNTVDKPVLVVPPGASVADRFRTALIAMEGTPEKALAVKTVVELAAGADVELVVVHVDDEASIPSFSDQVAHETEAYAQEFLARYVPGAPRARFEPRVGHPAEEIVAATADVGAEVIALGWRQSPRPDRALVAREVLERSQVPVLLVALAGGGLAE
ncbi:MAG TPA: universal stress protein [Acidimicrobiales bacterium]|nr:universal stress protein [Acidimicrobiales bacterium]